MHTHMKGATTANDQGNRAQTIFLIYFYGKQQLKSRLSLRYICFTHILTFFEGHQVDIKRGLYIT